MKMCRWLLTVAVCMFGLATFLNAQTLANAKPPAYPLAARAAGIDGPVIIKTTISKDGKPQNIHVVSGRPELRQAAIDAVQSWTYKPYLLNGQPTEVDTTVTVNFDMGKGKKKAAEQAKAQAELAKSMQQPSSQSEPQPAIPSN